MFTLKTLQLWGFIKNPDIRKSTRKGYYQNPPGDAVLMKKTLQEAAGASTDEDERDGSTKAAATLKHAAKANT